MYSFVQDNKKIQKKIDNTTLQLLYDNEITVDSKKTKTALSKYDDRIPLYDVYSDNVYLISKSNVYDRVMHNYYRFPDKQFVEIYEDKLKDINDSIDKNTETKEKYDKHQRYSKMLKFLSNYDLTILEETYLEVYYYYSNQTGKNLTLCIKPSFIPQLKHIAPYYTRSELINLALNQGIIQPSNLYYTPEKVNKLCNKISKNDISAKILLNHQKYIRINKSIGMVQYYTLHGSFFMNKYLRNNPQQIKNKLLESNINFMAHLINSAPSFDNSYTLYRFVETDDYLSNLKPGGVYNDPSFMSTTRDPFYRSDYYKFGFILLKIKIPEKTTGIALCLETYSHFPEEQEIVLAPGSMLKLMAKNDNVDYYHIDQEFATKIKRKYEFEYVGRKIGNLFERDYLPFEDQREPVDFMKITLEGNKLIERIKKFTREYVNTLYQFDTIINNKKLTVVTEWFNSDSVYNKFYSMKTDDGFSMYTFHDHNILFFLEFVDREIHVNYYFRYSESLILYETIPEKQFINFLAELAYPFGIQKVFVYSHYKYCYYEDISQTGNYNLDFYEYLKSSKKRFEDIQEIKPKFQYFQLDKLKNLSPDAVLRITDRDELYQIYMNHKTKTLAQFYLYIVETHCHMIHILEDKMKRLYQGIQEEENPFLYDYYVLDPFTYLFQSNKISSLPARDILETDKQQENKSSYRIDPRRLMNRPSL